MPLQHRHSGPGSGSNSPFPRGQSVGHCSRETSSGGTPLPVEWDLSKTPPAAWTTPPTALADTQWPEHHLGDGAVHAHVHTTTFALIPPGLSSEGGRKRPLSAGGHQTTNWQVQQLPPLTPSSVSGLTPLPRALASPSAPPPPLAAGLLENPQLQLRLSKQTSNSSTPLSPKGVRPLSPPGSKPSSPMKGLGLDRSTDGLSSSAVNSLPSSAGSRGAGRGVSSAGSVPSSAMGWEGGGGAHATPTPQQASMGTQVCGSGWEEESRQGFASVWGEKISRF